MLNLFQPPAGLLGDQEEAIRQQMQMQGLLGLAAGLFQAGTPSRTPQSLGGSALQGLMAGQQMASDTFNTAIKAQMLQEQIAEARRKRAAEEQLRTLIPQVFQVTRAPSTQEMIVSEQGNDYLTREGAVTGVKLDPAKLQALMMVPGGEEAVKGLAETTKLMRQAGLTAGAENAPSPFAPYLMAQSPEVKTLAATYEKAFKSGTIDEETAYKRIESLAKMEDSFITRQENKADRAAAREEGRAERALAREEKRMEGTEGQRTAAGYAERMITADAITKQLPSSALPTATTAAAGGVPLIGSYIQRNIMSPEQQLYKQASDDWIRAKLRKESGAVIGEEEMKREYETYFPQPGDSVQVIKQKEEARNTANQAMIKNAGAVFQMPTVAPRPTVNQTQNLQEAARMELERRQKGGR